VAAMPKLLRLVMRAVSMVGHDPMTDSDQFPPLLHAAYVAVRHWFCSWEVILSLVVLVAVTQAVQSFGPTWGLSEAVIQWVEIEGIVFADLVLLWFLVRWVLFIGSGFS